RSLHGCWTCRLRKKKCDEKHPRCIACSSLGLLCDGYGPKPTWMDGGKSEAEMTGRIKQIVKQTTQRKKIHRMSKRSARSQPTCFESSSNSQYLLSPLEISASSCQQLAVEQTNLFNCMDIKETTLFMHYFDQVFSNQLRFFGLSSVNTDRGWLLSLMTQTRSLYSGMLGLSACHKQSLLLQQTQTYSDNFTYSLLEKYVVDAYKELQMSVEQSGKCFPKDLKATIEAVACIIQLIFLDRLKACSDSQIHMKTASSLIQSLPRTFFSRPGTSPSLIDTPTTELDLQSFLPDNSIQYTDSGISFQDVSAIKFCVASFVWFDVLSYASINLDITRTNHRQLLEYHDIQLEQFMGCENWVMMVIMEISILNKWKLSRERAGLLSTIDLARRAIKIETLLKSGLERMVKSEKPTSSFEEHWDRNWVSRRTATVTKAFAYASRTYLHVVVSGAIPELPEIRESVSQTIEEFKRMLHPLEVESLTWPLCVTGCMATEGQRDFFADLMSSAKITESSSGQTWKAFQIVKECWRLRNTDSGNVDWKSAMDSLGYRVLLI
ncbi:uncharacterized protein LY89DRAFT_596526, partial [Mollisia scopiformis]